MKLQTVRIVTGIMVMVAGVCATAVPVYAATTRDDARYVLEKDKEVTGSLYLAGEEAILDGTVNGDVVVAESDLLKITGTVNGSVLAISSEIIIDGTVNGNVRVLSGKLTIAGTVTGDVTSASDTLLIKKEALIGDSLFYAGNTAQIEGTIKGELKKWLSSEQPKPQPLDLFFTWIFGFLSFGLFGVIVYSFQAREITNQATELVRTRFLAMLGIGLLVAVVGPIISLILFLTTVGSWLGFALFAALILIGLFGATDGAYAIGDLLMGTGAVSKPVIAVFLAGALVVSICSNIPIISIIAVILVLAGIGARATIVRNWIQANHSSAHA